ncbi:MAG: methyltransferase domain-containing protein, partial [Dehalococcoidia bacterium]|nr:methyltransferase domain-containing protein [Dehalococcoidia bacterium]
RVLDVGSATSRYLREMPAGCRVYAIDLRPTPPQPGVAVVRGDLMCAPFPAASFDVITCVSTIEHIGLDVYSQGPDEFGDEVAMRYLRRLLRPGGRLLLTAPFGRRAVSAWLRVYDRASFRRLTGGFRPLSAAYYRRDGDQFIACRPDELAGAPFDFAGMRSGGVVLAELTPAGPLHLFQARLSLRLRRAWRALTHRGPFWRDHVSGESAADWLKREQESDRRRAP